MAEINFEIEGKPGEVSAATFRESIRYATSLLREFDAAMSGHRYGTLRWYIERLRSNGTLAITFQSKLKRISDVRKLPPDIGPSVASSFITGFEDIEQKCAIPPYLSEFGLIKAGELAGLIGEETRGFRFESQSKSIEVTRKTSENISKLLPIKRTSVGSVEGKLETVSLHRKARFIVYHAITKKGIVCEFDQNRFMNTVRECLGKRVIAFGKLHKNVNGDTLRVSLERLEALDEEKRFYLVEEGELGDPEFTKAKSTAEYLRSIRGR